MRWSLFQKLPFCEELRPDVEDAVRADLEPNDLFIVSLVSRYKKW